MDRRALADDAPFAFNQAERAPIPLEQPAVETYEQTAQRAVTIDEPTAPSVPKRQKKRLLEAAVECITVLSDG